MAVSCDLLQALSALIDRSRIKHAARTFWSDIFNWFGPYHAELRAFRSDPAWTERRTCRRDETGRVAAKGRRKHRRAEGSVPAAGQHTVSQGQPLQAREGRARQEALCPYTHFGKLRTVLRQLPQPELRLGRWARCRRGVWHAQTWPAFADGRERSLEQHLHVGRRSADARGLGARSDPGGRRNEHAARQADAAPGLDPGI